MSEVTRLIVVRHGNTFNTGDVICRVGSATDIPLTETGMKQAYAAGEMIAELGFVPEVIFHAPLQRTCQSAVGVAASFPDVKLEEAEFLSELDYGNDDGKPEDEVVLRIGIVENSAAITPDTTIDELRAAGYKVGMIRPQTLFPFPEKALNKALNNGAKAFCAVEMSNGQMIDDVKLSINCQKPVHLINRMGGFVPSVEEIVERTKAILDGGAK